MRDAKGMPTDSKHLPGQHDQSSHGRRGVRDVVSSVSVWDMDIPVVGVEKQKPSKPKKSKALKPRNILPNVETTEFKGQRCWEDIDTVGEGQNYPSLEMAAAMVFDRLDAKDRGRVLKDPDEIDEYISDVIRKAGYGDRLVSITSNEGYLTKGIEAAVSRGMTETLPTDHPLHGKPVPVFLYRKRGVSEVAILHEVAHILEGAWKESIAHGGHTPTWWETWGQLMKQHGGMQTAINMAQFFGYSMEGTGVFE